MTTLEEHHAERDDYIWSNLVGNPFPPGPNPHRQRPRGAEARQAAAHTHQDYPIARPYAPPPHGSPYYKPMPGTGLEPTVPNPLVFPPPLPAPTPAALAREEKPRGRWAEVIVLAVVVWLSMTAGWFFFRGPGRTLFAGKSESDKPVPAVVADASHSHKDEAAGQHPREPAPQRPAPTPGANAPGSPAPSPAQPRPAPVPAPAPAPVPEPANNNVLTFEKHVLPIFQSKCVTCHGAEKRKGGIDLRTVAALVKGNSSGTALVPGKPDSSPVWDSIKNNSMPPGKTKLTATEKEIVEKWIAAGARER
jgi:cytochrome c551/c552